jgi:hypothetical protein
LLKLTAVLHRLLRIFTIYQQLHASSSAIRQAAESRCSVAKANSGFMPLVALSSPHPVSG